MYPTLVIVLVKTRRSMTDICEISTLSKVADPLASETRDATSNHLAFVVETRQVTFMPDNESHSRRASGAKICSNTTGRKLLV